MGLVLVFLLAVFFFVVVDFFLGGLVMGEVVVGVASIGLVFFAVFAIWLLLLHMWVWRCEHSRRTGNGPHEGNSRATHQGPFRGMWEKIWEESAPRDRGLGGDPRDGE